MKLNYTKSFFAAASAATMFSNAAVYSVSNLQTRTAGPIGTDATLTAGGTIGNNHGGVPLTINFTVTNQDLDGDGNLDDSFTFDLVASTTNANAIGVSTWGQGLSNSNDSGTGNAFSSIADVSVTVGSIVGATSIGDTVIFDGFTAATLASGSGAGTIVDRTVDAGGLTFTMSAADNGGFRFVQDNQSFGSPQSSLDFTNQGGTSGSLVLRTVDLQFSTVPAVPEPSSAVLLGLAGGMLAFRRRK
ncbi:PEP-CTERM sorting domain-containing protein [Akkermansiaceae bacterium]|nr:PEP-CTERM sorting domain-containing protein [Akkermansiaceae bacterium]